MTWDELMEAWESNPMPAPSRGMTHHHVKNNLECGDSVGLALCVENGVIVEATQLGRGCVLSQGVATYMCQQIVGLTVEAAKDFDIIFDFEITPIRKKCAALPLLTLHEALNETPSPSG